MTTVEAQPQERSQSTAQRRALADTLAPKLIEMRQRRRTIDDEDLNSYACWIAKRTRFMYDSEHFKHYIPAGRRAVERNVIRATQMLYPSSEYFEVYPGDEISLAAGKQAESVRAYMVHLIETRFKMRRVITQLIRCLYLYKRAIVKNDISVIDVPNVRYGGFSGGVRQIWPATRVVDPFSFYVWPETAVDYEDAEIFMEDTMMPWSTYQLNVKRKVCDEIKRSDLTAPEWPYHLQVRMAYSGLTTPQSSTSGGAPTLYDGGGNKITKRPARPDEEFVAISEVWCKLGGRWYQAWLAWNVAQGPSVVRLNPSPYPDPPYRVGLARPLPNQHYTNGLMSDIEPLNVWLNDVVNQSEEARTQAGLPPTVINTALVSRTDNFVWGPRRKWLVDGDANQAVKVLDVPDTSPTSQRQTQFVYGLIQALGGGGTIAEGQPGRNMPRGSNAVNNLISLSMADIEDIAKVCEQEILTPSLYDWFRLTLAFVPPAQVMAIPGARDFGPRTMTVNDLYGNWAFRWVGSLQAQNLQTKTQQHLVMGQLLAKAQMNLQAQGWAINWGVWAKRLWREGLGERGAESIIVPITELAAVNPAAAALIQMQIQQQLAQGAAGAPGAPQPGGPGTGAAQAPAAGPGDVQRQNARAETETSMGSQLAGLGR